MPRYRKTAVDKERGERLGRALQEARKSRTQSQLAVDAEVPLDTLRRIEQGRVSNPGLFTVAAIATKLDLSLDELVEPRERSDR